ncbi:hypothetical protein SteCoe_23810 [Stentor coeruleus]|uniref:Uncharacterized protein n=1 Tax=Stentor coeruleus TaxID=5963 RepID=A0A1R2BJ18_9CILI|nr:hypothetical protein SteCoe_23810 [Stentor coeruleus]
MFGNKKSQSLGRSQLEKCLESINTTRLKLETMMDEIEERKHQGLEKTGDNEKMQRIRKALKKIKNSIMNTSQEISDSEETTICKSFNEES